MERQDPLLLERESSGIIMSVKYRLTQDNRKNSKHYGQWYGRSVVNEVTETEDLAEKIESRCTVTLPDILAVISALVTAMRNELKQGNRVKLNGMGSFKVGLTTKPSIKATDFTASSNIKSMHVLFKPECHTDGTKNVSNVLLDGCSAQALLDYEDPAAKEKAAEKGNATA